MATLKEQAQNYEAPKTMNIADLKEVSVDVEIKNKVVKEGTPEQFDYDYILVEGVEYRVPISVTVGLQDLLAEKPDLKKFKAVKKGEGKTNTRYTVVAL